MLVDAIHFSRNELEASSRATYAARLKPLNEFCARHKLPFPPNTVALAAFLKELSVKGYSQSAIRGTVAAVSDLFRHSRDPAPSNSTLVDSVVKAAAKRAPAPKKRGPLVREHLLRIAAVYADRSHRPAFIRDFLMLLFAYRGCLRGGEVVNLRHDEVWLDTCKSSDQDKAHFPAVMRDVPLLHLLVSSSKTNPQRQKPAAERCGDVVIIGPDANESVSPVYWYRKWLNVRANHAFLFHSMNAANDRPLTVGAFNESVKTFATGIGIDPNSYYISGHSTRAGGATDLIRAGVDLRLVKRHGRWKSDAVLLYIKDDTASLLAVNAALGHMRPATAAAAPPAAALGHAPVVSNTDGTTTRPPVATTPQRPPPPTRTPRYSSLARVPLSRGTKPPNA